MKDEPDKKKFKVRMIDTTQSPFAPRLFSQVTTIEATNKAEVRKLFKEAQEAKPDMKKLRIQDIEEVT